MGELKPLVSLLTVAQKRTLNAVLNDSLYDDFMRGTTLWTHRWSDKSGDTGSVTVSRTMEGGIGVAIPATGTTVNSYGWLESKPATRLDKHKIRVEMRARAESTVNVGNIWELEWDSDNVICFRWRTDLPQYSCVTKKAGVETVTNITYPDITAYHVYVIEASEDEVLFYIDGELKARHTTNIPNTVPLMATVLVRTMEAVSKRIFVDYVRMGIYD